MRVVFDTNVLISAALFEQSVPFQALRSVLGGGVLLVSEESLNEVVAVLRREKFDRYISAATRERFLGLFVRRATVVQVTETIQVCRDSDDDRLLELALSGNADCIVTGDDDLLVLHPFRGIPILIPRDFLDWMETQA
ncbi:MAG: putative toxin-antitoxin system toxin component, PIN family [Bacteroidota bacterium]